VGWASWRMDGVKDDVVGYGKVMGCGDRDLNRSRERWLPRGRTIAQCWANVRPRVSMRVWPGDERSSTGAWRGSERSPSAGRTFASSVSTALLRGLRRTIAQCWTNVRFLSVFSTFERTSANDRPVLDERSLPQCANSHCARVKLKRNEKFKSKQN
jgi:hypothetical protein